nr:Casein kinase I isoform alpha-like [Polyrhizophydium stewartii]
MCATLLAIPAIYACPWPLDARNPVVLLGAIQLALMDLCKIPSDNGKRMWTVLRSLGKGGCGEVYLAQEVGRESKGEYVALKIVKLICACKKRRALVMDCHAESVATRFEKCRFKFSLKTVLMLALNMMTLSREFHDRTKMVHVDLKPSNFCTTHDGRKLVLIDFGYSTPPTVCLPGQTGTPLFMSWTIQSQGAVAPIWQDDLESLGYVIMFFVGGGKRGLPWGSMRTHRDIASAKNDDTIRSFCAALESTEFAPLAQPLLTYMFVTRDRIRKFVDADFEALFNMFHSVFTACGFVNDGMYDWCLNKKHASAHAAQHLAANLDPPAEYYPGTVNNPLVLI